MAAFEARKSAFVLKFKHWVPLPFKRLLFNLFLKKKPQYEQFSLGNRFFEGIRGSNQYGDYCIPADLDECPIRDALVQGDLFEADTIAFIERSNIEGDIVHAGSYFGDFLPALSKFINQNQTVWAFEPSPQFYDCARVTIQLNSLASTRLANKALGSEHTSKWLTTRSNTSEQLGGMSYISDKEESSGQVKCEVVRLDDELTVNSKIGLIHLDLEGYEQHALIGALGIIQNNKPILILETLPSNEWISQHLEPLGYRVIDKVDANYILAT